MYLWLAQGLGVKFKTPLRSGFLNVGERQDAQEKPIPAFAVTVLL